MKHNYKPLTTFRGWAEEQNGWVYGDLFHHAFDVAIQPLNSPNYFNVNKDSIGIYTGKDDVNGTPIFCGVDGALYGGDIVVSRSYPFYSDGLLNYIGHVEYYYESFNVSVEVASDRVAGSASGKSLNEFLEEDEAKVYATQYEQHLNENSE